MQQINTFVKLSLAVAAGLLAGCSKPATEPQVNASAIDAPKAIAKPYELQQTLYFGGDIITMAGDTPVYAEALVQREGKIIFMGSKADALATYGGKAQEVDLKGKTLLPSFIDAHSHYINALSVASQVKLYAPPAGPGKDVPTIISEIQQFVKRNNIPEGVMIMGYGYDDTVMPEGRLLNRDDLDAAFPNNPVRIDHVSMHGAVMNSLALKQFGIDANTKTPAGGIIVRKPGTNEPWGLIMETAFLPVFENAAPLTLEQEIAGTKAAQLLYASEGITTAQEGASHFPQLQTIQRATDAGVNLIDVVTFPFITDLDKTLAAYPVESWGKYNSGFKIGGVKISIDGSPQGRTAAFTTAYLTGGPGGEENWKGELFAPQDTINQGLKKVYALDVPVLFHVNGDAAIDSLITAHEFAASDDLAKPRNVTAIHAQFTRKDQIAKFVQYGIRPSFYTLHTYHFIPYILIILPRRT